MSKCLTSWDETCKLWNFQKDISHVRYESRHYVCVFFSIILFFRSIYFSLSSDAFRVHLLLITMNVANGFAFSFPILFFNLTKFFFFITMCTLLRCSGVIAMSTQHLFHVVSLNFPKASSSPLFNTMLIHYYVQSLKKEQQNSKHSQMNPFTSNTEINWRKKGAKEKQSK